MSNKISRRTFLKVTGASAAALGAAAVLGGCQAGDNSSIEVKVGDKISNWNNLAVQLTSVFTLASAPDAEGYEYIAMLITSANRSSRDTFAIGAQNIQEIGEAYPLDTPEQVAANTAGYFHALSASTTDFSFTCDGQAAEGGAYVQLYDSTEQECCVMINMVKLPTNKSNLFLRVAKGHFATSHSHINYYIDVTTQKSRLSEAKAVAKELVAAYQHSTIVDTVLCLDGTQVIGTCLANELTKDGFANMNAHQTIYVITPEYTTGSQIILRDNLAPMVKGKHVLILAASITTGYTVQAAIEAINYYGGTVAGLSAIFATATECLGIPVTSIFDPSNLPDYASFDSRECPMCKAGQHIDALVNSLYSAL